MKTSLIFLIFLFSYLQGKSQIGEFSFESSFQAIVDDSTAYACHYKNVWFFSTDCGFEVRINGILIENYEFQNNEDWIQSPGNRTSFYFCRGNDMFGFDTELRWAYIYTSRGKMQLYYETPQTFKFNLNEKNRSNR